MLTCAITQLNYQFVGNANKHKKTNEFLHKIALASCRPPTSWSR